MKLRYLLIVIIVIQLCVACFLWFRLFIRHVKVEVKSATSLIKKENIISTTSALLSYYELKPNLQQTWNNPQLTDITTTYFINKNGENDTHIYSQNKPTSTYRIVTLGDSITFGLYIPQQLNFSKVLESSLGNACQTKKIEVINLGVPGYDPTYEVEHFRLHGVGYHPDLVIWSLSNEDLYEVLEEMLPAIKKAAGNAQYTARLNAKENLNSRFNEDDLLAYQANVFSTFKKLYSGPLIIFSTTSFSQKQIDFMNNFISHRPKTYWLHLPDDLIKENALILKDSHPNIKGHALIAAFLEKSLEEKKLLSCRQ